MADDMRVLGVLAATGRPTGDGRRINQGSLRWSLPLPLRRAREDFGGHNGAVVVGAIEDIKESPEGDLMFTGKLFDTPDGIAARDEMYTRYASAGLKYGISVDLDDIILDAEDGEDEMTVSYGRLRGATLCDVPAYSTAYTVLAGQVQQSLVAAGSPRADMPRAWFENPRLKAETAMTVTSEGRIFGHCATWRTCHTSYGDRCVTPPRSATNYAYFNTGAVVTAEGDLVPVGHITMGLGHADPRAGIVPATEHYDNVNSIMADVTAGEDEFGIWLSGAIRDGVTDAQVRELLATAPSGDWRTINGNLEMVAVLNVVSPGFPVPRMRAMVAAGEVISLVASACFDSEANVEDETVVVEDTAAVEVEPSVDPAEVAPEVVAAEMAPAEPTPEEEKVAEVVEEAEAAVESPVVDMAEVAALVTELKDALAELRAAKEESPIEEIPAEDAEPVEAVPGIEHSQEDILAALDALVNGPKLSSADILAALDAKVG